MAGNAKRQSLFRANPGAISWAGKPDTLGMEAPLPATASLFDQQPVQAAPQVSQPAARPASMFSADPFGESPEALRQRAADEDRSMEDMRRRRAAMNDGSWYRALGVDPTPFTSPFSLFA